MNGYKMMAESYRRIMEHGSIDAEIAEKKIRIFEFLATCDKDDLCIMVDSSAFNDIITGYIKLAVELADLDDVNRNKIMKQIDNVLGLKNAKEVITNEK